MRELVVKIQSRVLQDNCDNPDAKYDYEDKIISEKTFKNSDPKEIGEYLIEQSANTEHDTGTIEIEWWWE